MSKLSPLPEPWVKTRQGLAEDVVGDVGVDFGRADAGMTEHLLHCQKVGAAFEQVGGEAVAEGVRTDVFLDAVAFGQFFYDEKNHLPRQARTAFVEKNRVGEFGFRGNVFPVAFKIEIENVKTAFANGHKAFFFALAEYADESVIFVDIADFQSNEF